MYDNYVKRIVGNLFLPGKHIPPEERAIPEEYVTFKWNGILMAGKNPVKRDGIWAIQVPVPYDSEGRLLKTYRTFMFPYAEISEMIPYPV